MRIGVMFGFRPGGGTLDELVAKAQDLEARGFDSMWLPHVFGHDSVTAAAIVGRETERIELGTAVVPSYPRHPTALAQQALTAGAACGGRFTLGIGLSHPVVIEGLLGLSYASRAKHMAEYVGVIAPLLRGEPASFQGEEFRSELTLAVPGAPQVPLLIGALGERMLEIAGLHASGTILWMTGPHTIETHTAPRLRAAAKAARRPAPRIVDGVHIEVTSDRAGAMARMKKRMGVYDTLPSYRAMLAKEGARHPADLCLVGNEKEVGAGLDRLRDVGVTDLEAVVLPSKDGSDARTLD